MLWFCIQINYCDLILCFIYNCNIASDKILEVKGHGDLISYKNWIWRCRPANRRAVFQFVISFFQEGNVKAWSCLHIVLHHLPLSSKTSFLERSSQTASQHIKGHIEAHSQSIFLFDLRLILPQSVLSDTWRRCRTNLLLLNAEMVRAGVSEAREGALIK